MKFLSSTVAALSVTGASASGAYASVGRSHDRAPIGRRDVDGPFIPTNAPYDNIFADITEDESEAIFDWLARQQNVTLPPDIEFSQWEPAWLLAPNKSEALAYFNDEGPKPERHARVLAVGDCFNREYMVGPLPVGDSTKAVPLDWANGGNATVELSDCTPDSELRSFAGSASGSGRHVHGQRSEGPTRRDTHNPYEEEMLWDGTELPHDELSPPVTILPDGARHEFDPKQNYVSWMDFSFFVSTGPAGISLHDIHFRGERIIYELAMQEALAHYAGPDETQTYASYLDVTIDFTNFNLVPGYDCPAYATYTDAFCLFEHELSYPIARHQMDYYHVTRNIAFMVRSVSTVGNYDYQTTYEFHLDGSVQVVVRASGYIQGSDVVDGDEPWEYGFRIRDNISGSMHDHVLNFKADLDIYGTKNSLFKTEFVPHSQVYDWSNGEVVNTMKSERSFITNEDEGKINWGVNAAAAYAVVNTDEPNEFGEYPGYRILPTTGSVIHATIENSTVFPDKINWATHHWYALQRKDSEPVSSHPAYEYGTKDVRVNFNDFFDSESLEQEDLVLYFNLGMHHQPTTEDLSTTLFQNSQSGMTFRPQNYKRNNSVSRTRQQIHLTNEDGEVQVERYGSKELSGSFDLETANPSNFPDPGEGWYDV